MTRPTDAVICKICGHDGDWHKFPVVCAKCPAGVCSDGPDGRRYRRRDTIRDSRFTAPESGWYLIGGWPNSTRPTGSTTVVVFDTEDLRDG